MTPAVVVLALLVAGAAPVRGDPTVAPATGRPAGWSEGEARAFLAGQVELGTTEHARAVAGWGRPWWLWGGLLADVWTNPDMATFTAGGRAALLAANLEAHWRVTRSWTRVAMPPLARHAEVARGEGSTLHAWDLDAWGVVPTPGGYLMWEGLATRLLGASRDVHVFDEGVHAIVRPPWCGLASLGWVADLAGGTVDAGASADLTFLGRGDARRVRAGPMLSWTPSPPWTLRGQLLFTLSSPDALPARDALSGGLVVGYRAATGTRGAARRPGAPP
ncbi:MAG TPA: hypothetical protein VF841_10750 [Anaeromyxobacter sp.]